MALSAHQATQKSSSEGTSTRFGPVEGWSVLAPHIAALALTAYSITKIAPPDRAGVLVPIAVGGLFFGLILAKLPVLDAVAHLSAIVTGVFVVMTLVAVRDTGLRLVVDERGHPVYQLGRDIVNRFARGSGTKLPDVEIVTLVAMTLWMVGYSSAWMLYRREWLLPSLVLPGTMMMVTMRYDADAPAFPVIGFLFCAILMSARHHAYRESRDWRRRRLAAPGGLPVRLAVSGAVIGALALLLGWGVTYQSSERLRSDVSNQSAQVWTKVQDVWTRAGLPGRGTSSTAGSYPTFPSSFNIGGNLDLSDAVVADVSAKNGHYLTVRSYDAYNGKGWATTVDSTFQLPGDKAAAHAIPIGFQPNQPVPFSQEIAASQASSQASVHIFAPKDGLVFTIESFDSSTLHTMALMGWLQLDHVDIEVAAADIATLPPDLQGLVRNLKQATFSAGKNGAEPLIVESSKSSAVAAERDRLKEFPVETAIKLNDDGSPVLTVTGRLPNYDDIEAVYQSVASNNATQYQVAGVETSATAAQLAAAGTDYPAWVSQRYVQQSSTVTARTKSTAESVVAAAGANTPFAKAWAIQEYLTGPNFTYQLNSPGPPDGQDFVDYFLFDSKVGRCEQFATSMVVMLRELGVPARLVSGYRVGSQDANGNWVYRENQAHTWVEVYFPSKGWAPFEPTKGQDPFSYGRTKAPADSASPTPDAAGATPEATVVPDPTASATATATPVPVVNNTDDPKNGGHWWSGLSRSLLAIAAVSAVFAVVVCGSVLAWIWGLRGLSPAAGLYARSLRLGKFLGIRSDPTMTPTEFAAAFSEAAPGAGPAMQVVTELYLAERYGAARVDQLSAAQGQSAWRQLRRHFLVWRSRRARRHHQRSGAAE